MILFAQILNVPVSSPGGFAPERLHPEGLLLWSSAAGVQQRDRLHEEPGGRRLPDQPLSTAPNRQLRQQLRRRPPPLLQLWRLRLLSEHVRKHPVHGFHRR